LEFYENPEKQEKTEKTEKFKVRFTAYFNNLPKPKNKKVRRGGTLLELGGV
jgi:hypothetical protein